jgi:hypothetical protein
MQTTLDNGNRLRILFASAHLVCAVNCKLNIYPSINSPCLATEIPAPATRLTQCTESRSHLLAARTQNIQTDPPEQQSEVVCRFWTSRPLSHSAENVLRFFAATGPFHSLSLRRLDSSFQIEPSNRWEPQCIAADHALKLQRDRREPPPPPFHELLESRLNC